MDELRCTCGGTFQFWGKEFLRTGKVPVFLDNDWTEKHIPVELYLCPQCRTIRILADSEWFQEQLEERKKYLQAQEEMHRQDGARLQQFLQDFANYTDRRLERIASGSGLLDSGYDEVARAAARQLLEERKQNPDAAPREQEHVQPEPRSSWTRRKNSKPPWER